MTLGVTFDVTTATTLSKTAKETSRFCKMDSFKNLHFSYLLTVKANPVRENAFDEGSIVFDWDL